VKASAARSGDQSASGARRRRSRGQITGSSARWELERQTGFEPARFCLGSPGVPAACYEREEGGGTHLFGVSLPGPAPIRQPAVRPAQPGRDAACRRMAPATPLSSTGPISRKATSAPAEASTTSWLTSTSLGRAYSAIREATFTVWP